MEDPAHAEAAQYAGLWKTVVVYQTQFPVTLQTGLSLPAQFRPSNPDDGTQAEDPIVPSAGINDRSLRVRDFFRFGMKGTTTDGRELASGDIVIRPSAVWVCGVAETQPILHAGEELHLVWELEAAGGGGLPPGLYRPYVLYDTRTAVPGSSITRCYLGRNAIQLLVKEARTEGDRREEAICCVAYDAVRNPRRAWDALEQASKWYPESGRLADARAAILVHYGEFERLWEELPRIDPLVQDVDRVAHDQSLPLDFDMMSWASLTSPTARPFLKLLAEILQPSSVEVALKKAEELRTFVIKAGWRWAGDIRALLRRHRSRLPKEVSARLEAIAAEVEQSAPADKLEEWKRECAQREGDIDRLIAAGGLTAPADGLPHVSSDPSDHPDPNAGTEHPGDAKLHPSAEPSRSAGDRAPGAPLLWPAVGLLGLAGCAAAWALLRNRRRA